MESACSALAFHRGGTAVWQSDDLTSLRNNPVNQLIQQIIIPFRTESTFQVNDSRLFLETASEYDLIFIVVCSSLMGDSTGATLARAFAQSFLTKFKSLLVDFAKTFRAIPLASFEADWDALCAKHITPVDDSLDALVNAALSAGYVSVDAPSGEQPNPSNFAPKTKTISAPLSPAGNSRSDGGISSLADMIAAARGGRVRGGRGRRGGAVVGGGRGQSLHEPAAAIDIASSSGTLARDPYLLRPSEAVQLDAWDSILRPTSKAKAETGGIYERFMSALRAIPIAERAVTKKDLEAVAPLFREQLIKRNVAYKTADEIVAGSCASLVGRTIPALQTVHAAFKDAVREAIVRILGGSLSVDVLGSITEHAKRRNALLGGQRDAKVAPDVRAPERPYVLLFCGVNGVGKTTSLAKLAYWLSSAGDLKVLLAACDTFRTGAIEQLRTHANVLGLEMFEAGYGQNDAEVAYKAIATGITRGVDVVLVDSAGRMQQAESLMRSLRLLVKRADPDCVMFVGEAGAGSDVMSQVSTFSSTSVERPHFDAANDDFLPRTLLIIP